MTRRRQLEEFCCIGRLAEPTPVLANSPVMFVSLPPFEIQPPPDPLGPCARYWCGLGVAGDDAWFIVRMTLDGAAEHAQLTVLTMDSSELLAAIGRLEPQRIESLICVLPPELAASADVVVRLAEIWISNDTDDEHDPTVIFRDEAGVCRAGRQAAPVNDLGIGMRLMLRVGAEHPA